MKQVLLAFLGAGVMTGCAVVEEEPTVSHRHYVQYYDDRPYYRVHYVDQRRRPYYRQVYYEDVPEYRTYRSTQRYYYHPRRDSVSVHLGL